MKTYTLSQQGILRIRRQYLLRMGIISAVAFCVGVGINIRRADDNWFFSLIIFIALFAGIVIFSILRGLKQNKEIWESIKIEVGDDYIARSQVRIPQVCVNLNEIKSVEETNGGLCIRTSDKLRTLAIPIMLDGSGYQEIKSTLSTWTTIQPKSAKAQIQNLILLVVLIVGFVILFISSSLWLVLFTGLAMTGYYGYIYWTLGRTEGVDPRFRGRFLLLVIFPIFLTVMKVCTLSGELQSFLQ